jgi:hypothetical protein
VTVPTCGYVGVQLYGKQETACMAEAHSYEGNTEEENNGYVVFKRKKSTNLPGKEGGGEGGGIAQTPPAPPNPFYNRLLH